VTMVCSDPLNDNPYEENEEIKIVPADKNAIINKLELLISNKDLCYAIGQKGMLKTRKLFIPENTLLPKYETIKALLNG
ncbi:MAG: hypothetical protein C0594_17355, partial [Marinilabiliales bacterium]